MPEVRAHYYIEGISLHTVHPAKGGVLLVHDNSTLIAVDGRVRCDILDKYVPEYEGERPFCFLRVRAVHPLTGKVMEGWTWKDNVHIKFEENLMDGRFNEVD